MTQFLRRLQYLLHRRRFDQELASDMEFHREMAARQGNANFGNALLLREEARDAWGWTWIDRLFQDVRYAARILRKSPGFTLAAILMLAIGIGASVATFGFFDLMVLRPLDVRDPATLLRFHRHTAQQYAFALPYPEMDFFRQNTRTLSAVLALNTTRLSVEGESNQLDTHFITANFFSELGAAAKLGRLLDATRDESSSAEPVVVLSHSFWQRHFGADPTVIGQKIRLNGKPASIIGVARAEFAGLSLGEPAFWAPITQQPYFVNGSHLLTDFAVESPGVQTWGRLQPGFAPKVAEDELASLAAELRKQHPAEIWEKESLPSEPGGYANSLMVGNRRGTGAEGRSDLVPVFGLIGTLALLILTVACANLGSLLLARGVAREREISIRLAVGAASGRLIRQLFTESLLLALLGSAAGAGLGFLILQGLMSLTGAPAWLDPRPDWRVIVFALCLGCAAAVLFGLAPAFQVARRRHRNTARQFLVAAQVAASCILLIVAGLLGRALNSATSADPGFDYQRVISINPELSKHGYSPARSRAYFDALQGRLRALPGVQAVSLALTPPLGRGSITGSVTLDTRTIDAQINRVDPEFFTTMGIRLLRGRNLIAGDTRAVVISESLARALSPGQDALGKRVNLGTDYTVIGIARNARLIRPEDSDSVEVYLPIEAADLPAASVLVKASIPPEDLARSVAPAARALLPDTFPEVQLLDNSFHKKLQASEYSALTVSLLSLIAHVLACLGIVGLVAYAVSQRTREIGIRMALGARPAHVLAIVLRQLARPVIAGLIAGIAGASALSQFLRQQLYGISNLDPATYCAAIAVFVITVILAAILPARRALRIDPLRALRYE